MERDCCGANTRRSGTAKWPCPAVGARSANGTRSSSRNRRTGCRPCTGPSTRPATLSACIGRGPRRCGPARGTAITPRNRGESNWRTSHASETSTPKRGREEAAASSPQGGKSRRHGAGRKTRGRRPPATARTVGKGARNRPTKRQRARPPSGRRCAGKRH